MRILVITLMLASSLLTACAKQPAGNPCVVNCVCGPQSVDCKPGPVDCQEALEQCREMDRYQGCECR